MAIAVSPRPNDGPLSAKGPTIQLDISTTSSCSLNVFLRSPDGTRVRVENQLLAEGNTSVVITLPPGGVPSGTRLILVLDEADGRRTTARYALK